MLLITDYIDAKAATIKDARVTRGEAIFLDVKPNIELKDAMWAVVNDLMRYMSKSTGKMYTQSRESYSEGFRIIEPGHPSYGLKVQEHSGQIIIQAIAVLEDVDIMRRYARRLKIIDAEQNPTDAGK
jgi:hypothetical protein